MKHKSIFNAVAVAVVAVALIIGGGASAQTKSAPPKIDPRLVGTWWSGSWVDGECKVFTFTKNGTGGLEQWCSGGIGFEFTIANGWIKFSNAVGGDEDGSYDVKLDDLDFSFSDDGKTLILGGKMFKKVVKGSENANCC